MAGKFVVKKASNGKFHFQLKAGNGETILSSEMYDAKPSCLKGIDSVKANAGADALYEKKQGKKGPMFNLKAKNGQIIGTSESYSSESSRDAGIKAVMANAAAAATEDQTAA